MPRSSSSRSACFCEAGQAAGPAHVVGQRAVRRGAPGEVEPAVLAVIIELAARERGEEITGGEALDDSALAQQLVQPPLRRGDAVERDLRVNVMRGVVHDVMRDRAIPARYDEMHGD